MQIQVGMNADMLKGKWHEIRGSLRQRWGRLTDSDFEEKAMSSHAPTDPARTFRLALYRYRF